MGVLYDLERKKRMSYRKLRIKITKPYNKEIGNTIFLSSCIKRKYNILSLKAQKYS